VSSTRYQQMPFCLLNPHPRSETRSSALLVLLPFHKGGTYHGPYGGYGRHKWRAQNRGPQPASSGQAAKVPFPAPGISGKTAVSMAIIASCFSSNMCQRA
jgi:hypothetical protein